MEGPDNGIHIVVAVDESPLTIHLLDEARRICTSANNVTVVHIVEEIQPSLLDPLHDTLDRIQTNEQRVLSVDIKNKCEQYFNSRGWFPPYENVNSDGSETPSAILTKFVHEKKGGLLIVGQGTSVLDHFLLGSNSLRLARDCERKFAVLVVKNIV